MAAVDRRELDVRARNNEHARTSREEPRRAVTGRSESEAGCGAADPEEEDKVAATAEA